MKLLLLKSENYIWYVFYRSLFFLKIMLWIVRVLLYFPLNKSDDTISTLLLIFENKLLLCIWEHTCIHRHKENFGSQRTLYSYFFIFLTTKILIFLRFLAECMPNKEWVVRYSEILPFYVCVTREYWWIWKENALPLKRILILSYGWKLAIGNSMFGPLGFILYYNFKYLKAIFFLQVTGLFFLTSKIDSFYVSFPLQHKLFIAIWVRKSAEIRLLL